MEREMKSEISRARQFYIETNVGNSFKCKTCGQLKSGAHPRNLVSHYKSMHYEIYMEHIGNPPEDIIKVQRLKVLHSCVELVTVNSQPFSLLSSSGFRYALESKLREFQLAGQALNLSDQHVYEVKKKIHQCRANIEDRIRLETKNQVVSLMVDAATRNGRSIFGVNIQYRYDGKLRLATLAMQELKKSHTASYLSDVIISILSKFQIKLEQILTVTTDNGSNMIATVKKLEKRIFGPQNLVESDAVNGDSDSEAEEQDRDTAALDCLLDDSSEFDQLHTNIFERLRNTISNRTLFLSLIRCAAHSLQLVVWDAMNDLGKNDSDVIELCRNASKFLRLQSSQTKLKEASLKCTLPKLDCRTRWSSTYVMVSKIYIFYIKNIVFCSVSIHLLF